MSVFKKNGFVLDVSLDAVKSQPVSGTTNATLIYTLEVIHTLAQTHTQTCVVTCARACVHTHIHMSTHAHHAYIKCLAALLTNAHM